MATGEKKEVGILGEAEERGPNGMGRAKKGSSLTSLESLCARGTEEAVEGGNRHCPWY